MTQLEGSTLKAHVTSRADFQDEAKVNVDEMAQVINQQVAIVSVLSLS
jgi:hypothetical protein